MKGTDICLKYLWSKQTSTTESWLLLISLGVIDVTGPVPYRAPLSTFPKGQLISCLKKNYEKLYHLITAKTSTCVHYTDVKNRRKIKWRSITKISKPWRNVSDRGGFTGWKWVIVSSSLDGIWISGRTDSYFLHSLSLCFFHFWHYKWTQTRNVTRKATCQCLLSQQSGLFFIKKMFSNTHLIEPMTQRWYLTKSRQDIWFCHTKLVFHNSKQSWLLFFEYQTVAAKPANKSVGSQWFGHELEALNAETIHLNTILLSFSFLAVMFTVLICKLKKSGNKK